MEEFLSYAENCDFGCTQPLLSSFHAPSKSEQLLQLLQNLARSRDELCLQKIELLRLNQFLDSQQVNGKQILQRRLQLLQNLEQHLTEILNKKGILIAYLQRPFSREHLVVDVSIQTDFCELLTSISKNISLIATHFQSIQAASKLNLQDRKLETILNEIESNVAKYECFYQMLLQTQSKMDDLLELERKRQNENQSL
jgi:hypothetical protein